MNTKCLIFCRPDGIGGTTVGIARAASAGAGSVGRREGLASVGGTAALFTVDRGGRGASGALGGTVTNRSTWSTIGTRASSDVINVRRGRSAAPVTRRVTGVAIATSDEPVEDGAADEETDVTAGEPSAGDADWPAPADAQLLSSATATQ